MVERETKQKIGPYPELFKRLIREKPNISQDCQYGYVMSETKDNQTRPLLAASNLLRREFIEKIAIPDPSPPYTYGYPGPEYCKQILKENGLDYKQIVEIKPKNHNPHMNTQTELQTLSRYIKEKQYTKNILIIAPWFHVLRSYITALSELKKIKMDIKIFVLSVPYKASEAITHSQGIQRSNRRAICWKELKKCQEYDNLISGEEALNIFQKHRYNN
ncbi:MAG: hypothetical protein ABH812_01765 [bacterium]